MESEMLLDVNGIRLCASTFGDPADPAVLLIHGACASQLWWQQELCEQLADAGHFVIRYDQRDTGRSSSFPPGAPGYAMSDLVADAVGLLDALGVRRAHVVGRSMSGGTALALGLDHPDRVASLTFLSTTTGDDDLPDGTLSSPEPTGDPAQDAFAMIRAYAGDSPHFDAPATRALVEQDLARTADVDAMFTNHFRMEFDAPLSGGGFGDLRVPALVVHGELDPAFPPAHAHALHRAIPGSTLLLLPDMGHDLPAPVFGRFVAALSDLVGRTR